MPGTFPQLHRVIAGIAGGALLLLAGLTARSQPQQSLVGTVNDVREVGGVRAIVTIWAEQGGVNVAREAAARALDRFEAVLDHEARLSPTLAELAERWKVATGGAFDPEALPLYQLWEAKLAEGRIPSPEEIARCKDPLLRTGEIGFGIVAIGWAVDEAAAELHRSGFDNYWVATAGCQVVHGTREGRPWRLAIDDPSGSGYLAIGELRPGALVVHYREDPPFLLEGCERIGILDPSTGRPAKELALVLTFAPHAADAAALALAIPVLGAQVGLRLAHATPEIEALAISSQGALHASDGVTIRSGRLTWLD